MLVIQALCVAIKSNLVRQLSRCRFVHMFHDCLRGTGPQGSVTISIFFSLWGQQEKTGSDSELAAAKDISMDAVAAGSVFGSIEQLLYDLSAFNDRVHYIGVSSSQGTSWHELTAISWGLFNFFF